MSFRLDTPIKKIRKARPCAWCAELLEAGQPAVKVSGIGYEGDFFSAVFHPECNAAEIRWWRLPINHHEESWPEERMPRGSEFCIPENHETHPSIQLEQALP